MKHLNPGMIAAALLLVTHSTSAQDMTDDYEFFYPKIKFTSMQTAPEGTTFKLGHVKKTDRLSEDNLNAMAPLTNIDLKYSRKEPSVIFFFNVSGITVKNLETFSEGGKYFKRLNYTIKSSIDCIGKDGATFNSLPVEDGSKVKTIVIGSNFFRQQTFDNNKYPKPKEIPNIDASPGYVPSFEEAFGKLPATGFYSTIELDTFTKRYMAYIEAKAEAKAIEAEFNNGSNILMNLFGSGTWRETFCVAKVKKGKNNTYDYTDLDKAAEDIKSAYKILSVNVTDTAAYYPLLRSAVNTYTAVESAHEERMKSELAQSIIQHNLCIANAWLLNADEAIKYAGKLAANKRAAPGPIEFAKHTVRFLQTRAATKDLAYTGNLLDKMPK
jgi:hypothetical protein